MDETPRSWFPPTRANVNYYAPAHKQHAAFWYEDGTVILVAQDVGFCVHAHRLGRDSPVFRKLFAELANPTRVGQRGRLCMPFALYIPWSQEPDIPFSVLSALMRLGRAYEMTTLVHEAAEYLRVAFTNDFDVWLEGRERWLAGLALRLRAR
ncbi:hypothetical protein BN946_scf184701.g10 [Trametes cinnabarina]|uniref:BTB domain-containing protein n=1 Tax=Pycnoporus cinnabarinus TaxID=5643 RepID=A0A060SUJ1_PYCCI|nr:hypothetical protein BN946_scf184701.g10 [Trametes cinnabarina]